MLMDIEEEESDTTKHFPQQQQNLTIFDESKHKRTNKCDSTLALLTGIITSDLFITLLSQASKMISNNMDHSQYHTNSDKCVINCNKDKCSMLIKKIIIPLTRVSKTFNNAIISNRYIWFRLYTFINYTTDMNITLLLEKNTEMIRKLTLMKYIIKPLLDMRNGLANYCKSPNNLPLISNNLHISTTIECVFVIEEKTIKNNGDTHTRIREATHRDPMGCVKVMRKDYFNLAIQIEYTINSFLTVLHLPTMIS